MSPESLHNDVNSNITTLIVAGGEGKRLRPLTYIVPKPMITWNGKRLIDYTLELASELSDHIAVSASTKVSKPIFTYLKRFWPEIIRLEEPQLLKTGGVIKYHMNTISDMGTESLLLLMSDHVRQVNLSEVVQYHISSNNDITVLVSTPSDKHNQIVVDNGKVIDYLGLGKNSQGTSFSSSGEFVFNWEALEEFLKKKDEDIFDVGWGVFYKMFLAKRYTIKVFDIGNWEDLGTWQRFVLMKNRRDYR